MTKIRNIVFGVMVLTVSCIFTGCGNHEEKHIASNQPQNISLVAAIANNNPVLDTGIDELAQLSDAPGSTYSCILADSTPSLICHGTIPDFNSRGFSDAMLARAKSGVADDINQQLDTAQPDSNQVDIAAATALAIRQIRSDQVVGRENILVYYASGISTSGLIDMVSVPLYNLDIESSVKTLVKTMNLDMKGIRVVFYCCGDVNGEQTLLSNEEKTTLKQFYSSLFTNMGAEKVTFMDNLPLEREYSFKYKVDIMETKGQTSGLTEKVLTFEQMEEETVRKQVEEVFSKGEILSFDEKSIAFLPESTELADPDVAMSSVHYIVDYMQTHPEFTLMICGTTTSAGEQDSCIDFSKKRAESIRALFQKAGIDDSRIVTLGCGWSSCLYVSDRDAKGNLDEKASQNRSVKLIDYNSQIASEIIQSLQ